MQVRVRWSLSKMADSVALAAHYTLRFRVGAIERITLKNFGATKTCYRSEQSLPNTFHHTFTPIPAQLKSSDIRKNK